MNFKHVDTEIIELLQDFFYQLKQKVKKTDLKQIEKAIEELEQHPSIPKINTIVSFNYEDVTLSIIYTNYKIELSDSLRESWEGGGETIERFLYKYEPNGYREHKGNLYEFRDLLLSSLREVEEISVSDEE